MADVVGLAIGVVALAGLVTTCLECFEYVQLGRNFATDFQTSRLKLDIAALSLSRWWQAINDTVDIDNENPSHVAKAKEILCQIIELFKRAEDIARKYDGIEVNRTMEEFQSDALTPDVRKLHEKMRNLVLKRQKTSSLKQRTTWAIHDKKELANLLDDITSLTDGLWKIFPPAQQQNTTLCLQDANALKDEPALNLLTENTTDLDPVFHSCIVSLTSGQLFHGNTTTGQARAVFGDHITNGFTGQFDLNQRQYYIQNSASGDARVQYGTQFGGKGVFDD